MPTTVTSKIGATNSPTTMDYTTLQAWEDACPANLVTDDKIWRGECYDQGEFTGTGVLLTISGTTTDATRYVELTCAAGASFNDKAGVRSNALYYNASGGVAIRRTSGYGFTISNLVNYTRLNNLQIKKDLGNGAPIGPGSSQQGTWIDRCILHLATSLASICLNLTTTGSVKHLVSNSLILGKSANVHCTVYSSAAYNCTCISTDGLGTNYSTTGYGTGTVKNCAGFGAGAFLTGTPAYADYNASDIAGLGGAHSLSSLTFADQFVSTTNDFRTVDTGSLDGAGTPDATYAPTDISNTTRHASTPTIGCWEVVAAAAASDSMKPLSIPSALLCM